MNRGNTLLKCLTSSYYWSRDIMSCGVQECLLVQTWTAITNYTLFPLGRMKFSGSYNLGGGIAKLIITSQSLQRSTLESSRQLKIIKRKKKTNYSKLLTRGISRHVCHDPGAHANTLDRDLSSTTLVTLVLPLLPTSPDLQRMGAPTITNGDQWMPPSEYTLHPF